MLLTCTESCVCVCVRACVRTHIILIIHFCYGICIAPSAPRSLNITASTATLVTLSWMPPDPPNGMLSIYQITYNEEGTPDNGFPAFIASTTITIRSLQSNVVYIVNVRASTISETFSLIFGAPATLRIMNGMWNMVVSYIVSLKVVQTFVKPGAWFLEIVFMKMSVCVCVCPPPRLLKTIHVK